MKKFIILGIACCLSFGSCDVLDVNTFDFVIMCLIEICEHTWEQAEQCTILVHYKGKCTVKTGALEKLKPMNQALLDKGLSSEIV
jgi:ATP-dependent Clp protease adaptor protein ClpS